MSSFPQALWLGSGPSLQYFHAPLITYLSHYQAIAQLTAKLQESATFTTYRKIQAWLELELEIQVSYDVVYYLVHDKLKIALAKTQDK